MMNGPTTRRVIQILAWMEAQDWSEWDWWWRLCGNRIKQFWRNTSSVSRTALAHHHVFGAHVARARLEPRRVFDRRCFFVFRLCTPPPPLPSSAVPFVSFCHIHATFCHTQHSVTNTHTTLCHTHNALSHTTLCHTHNILSHTQHSVTHNTLSHTTFCHTQHSVTHNTLVRLRTRQPESNNFDNFVLLHIVATSVVGCWLVGGSVWSRPTLTVIDHILIVLWYIAE